MWPWLSEPVQNQFEPVQPSLSQSSQTMHTHKQLSVKVTQYIHINSCHSLGAENAGNFRDSCVPEVEPASMNIGLVGEVRTNL